MCLYMRIGYAEKAPEYAVLRLVEVQGNHTRGSNLSASMDFYVFAIQGFDP